MGAERPCSPARMYEVESEADVICVSSIVSAAQPYRRPYNDLRKADHPKNQNMVACTW
jgi:hypothetical protein